MHPNPQEYVLLDARHATLTGLLLAIGSPDAVSLQVVPMLQEGPPPPGSLLTQATTRFLRHPPKDNPTKMLLKPSSKDIGRYGSIHALALRPGLSSVAPVELKLLHYVFRDSAERAAQDYGGPADGKRLKREIIHEWEQAKARALEAWKQDGITIQTSIGFETGMLRHATAIYRSLASTWTNWTGPTTQVVQQLLGKAAEMASRKAVVLAAAARSGSTTFAGLGFALHPGFHYWFEPCRQGGGLGARRNTGQVFQPTGALHGPQCAVRASAALSCQLTAGDFELLWADTAVMRQSSLGLGKDPLETRRLLGEARAALRYERMMQHCWQSHRAVKLVRLGNSSLAGSPLPLPHVVELTRHPALIVRSRLSLLGSTMNSQWSEFHRDSRASSVASSVCTELEAQLDRADATGGRLLRIEDFNECPITKLVDLYAWLGVGPLPQAVRCRVDCTCADDGLRHSRNAPRFGVRWNCVAPGVPARQPRQTPKGVDDEHVRRACSMRALQASYASAGKKCRTSTSDFSTLASVLAT